MLSLLKIKVSGYKLLENNFEIDFTNKAKVNSNDLLEEVYCIKDKLHSFNILAFTGSNSSGKSTVLNLIKKCYIFIMTGRWLYESNEFKNDKIELEIEFYINKKIYRSLTVLENKARYNNLNTSFCIISKDELYFGKKNKLLNESIGCKGNDDTSVLRYITPSLISKFSLEYFEPFTNNIENRSDFFNCFKLINNELLLSIISLLDESIEHISLTGNEMIKFKRFNQKEEILSKKELLSILSNGTIKGIELYCKVIITLINGGLLIVDEIENCFHKNLVNNILFLFKDKNINQKEARIIFSTHYVEILDTFKRRDNIFILHKDKSNITIENMYLNYNLRTELLKSKQFNNNTFNTLLNYEKLMIIKRIIKNEISNND